VSRPCEACGSPRLAPLLAASGDRGEVGRCADCGLVSVLEPPPPQLLAGLYDDPAEYRRYIAAQRTDGLRRRHAEVLDRLTGLVSRPGRTPALFDVGAGRGDFLDLARRRGFRVAGNELSAAAADLCAATYGIELTVGDLGGVPGAGSFDAVTMWCVLAHVPDPARLLTDTLRLLRPGGVLYLHTPRWCGLDTAGRLAARLSAGRLSQVSDRRVNSAHLRLFGRRSMTALARSCGFEPVAVTPTAAWSLVADAYLDSMGVPGGVRRVAAPALDRLVGRGAGVRNVLDVYLRRPEPLGTAAAGGAAGSGAAGSRSSSSGTAASWSAR
jgi:SAM-dependent methyltransferase